MKPFAGIISSATLLAAVLLLAVRDTASARSIGETADALAQRFLAHMAMNGPLAGTFQITTVTDREMLSSRQAALDLQYKGRVTAEVPPADQTLECRWAWNKGMELTETLPGSRDDFVTFLSHPEGLLDGSSARMFNLHKPQIATRWRPACFYSLACMASWEEALRQCRFELGKETSIGNADVDTLVATDTKQKSRFEIAIDRQSGALRRCRTYYKDVLGVELRVLAFVQSPDHRAFPARAEMDTYNSRFSADRPYSKRQLLAKTVIFPRTTEEAERHLRLDLTAGTMVADRVLDRESKLQHAASAKDLVEGKIRLARLETAPTTRSPLVPSSNLPEPVSQPPLPWLQRPASVVFAAVGGAAVILVLGYIARRYRAAR
jgi:hypothetical protein